MDWKRFKTSDWNHQLTGQAFNRVHEVKKYGCFSVDRFKVSKVEELCRNFFSFFFSSTKQNSNSTIFVVPSVHAAILWTCTTFKMQLFQSSGGVSLNCYFSPSCNSSPVIQFFSNLWLDAALGDHAPARLKETPPLLLLFLVIRYPPAGWGCCHCLLTSLPGQTAERVRTWPYSPYFASFFFLFFYCSFLPPL